MSDLSQAAAAAEDDEVPTIEDVGAAPIRRDQMPQKDYYKKWDAFTADSVDQIAEEEKKQREESDRALGKDKAFASEAHKKDKTTHLALKEAKKLWDKRRAEEVNMKHELEGLEGEDRELTAVDLGGKKVLALKKCKNCRLTLPASLQGLIKVFVEHCSDVVVTLRCKLITSNVEVSHCEGVELVVEEALHTTQVDLSRRTLLRYGPGVFTSDHKIYSAGCLDLRVVAAQRGGDASLESRNDYIADLAPLVLWTPPAAAATAPTAVPAAAAPAQKRGPVVGLPEAEPKAEAAAAPPAPALAVAAAAAEKAAPAASEAAALPVAVPAGGMALPPDLVVRSVPAENAGVNTTNSGSENGAQASFSDPRSEEQHFITALVPGRGLVTEVAVQVGSRWATRRELDLETATQAEVTAREMQENAFKAEREKLAGNQSFSNAEYSQAAVHYTVAIDLATTADSLSTQFPLPVSPLIHQCYSNRAACFLKLGQHERALADADSCIGTAPDGFVKGHFRRGLALHALGRYAEALPSLGRALRLESPKAKASLKQINEAITFAERKLQVEIRARMGK